MANETNMDAQEMSAVCSVTTLCAESKEKKRAKRIWISCWMKFTSISMAFRKLCKSMCRPKKRKNPLDGVAKSLGKVMDMRYNLSKRSLFMNRDSEFINAVLMQLEHEFFAEGSIIIDQNALPDRMCFIEHGRVLEETTFSQRELHDGEYFGEFCFLFGGKQLAEVRALTDTSLFSLFFNKFQQIKEEFPDVVNDLMSRALQRKEDLEVRG